jgi:hypothetical protein
MLRATSRGQVNSRQEVESRVRVTLSEFIQYISKASFQLSISFQETKHKHHAD